MDLEQLLELFSSTKITEVINQTKASPRFVSDTFFKDKIPSLESTVRVEIIKGAGIVLNSISDNGEHSLENTKDAYILNIPLPRFALAKRISASEINSLRSLALQEAQAKSLSGALGVLVKEMKESFNTTLEYMANGALTKQDLKEIEVISKYYEISLIEAAKIHYGKAIITEEMIERLERSYRELYEQYKKLSINEQGKFLHNLLLNNQDEYAEAIRFIQIAEESVNIALKSKNKDIAESRRKLALEIEQKIQKGYPKAYDIIQLLEDNYDVNLFENQCIKYYEEAQKLKTIKSKQKRIDYINDLIKEAEINPKIDEKFVNFWKNKVKEIQ